MMHKMHIIYEYFTKQCALQKLDGTDHTTKKWQNICNMMTDVRSMDIIGLNDGGVADGFTGMIRNF